MSKIPIISLWRPWANWVALGWKKIETREHARFASLVNKRIGIHAAQKWDNDWKVKASEFLTADQIEQTTAFPNLRGGVICTTEVYAERWLVRADSAGALIDCNSVRRHGLFLRDVVNIKFVQMSGRQGIWYVDNLTRCILPLE